MHTDLLFPIGPFHSAREHINALCYALAYAATDEEGALFVRAFLHTDDARRLLNEALAKTEQAMLLLNEAQRVVRDQVE
jgi:hypothetical protein